MHTDVRVWRMRTPAKHPLLEKPVEIPDLKYVLLSLQPVVKLIYLFKSELSKFQTQWRTWPYVYLTCVRDLLLSFLYVPEIHQMSSFPVFKQRKDSNNIFLRRRQRKYHRCLGIKASNLIALRKTTVISWAWIFNFAANRLTRPYRYW